MDNFEIKYYIATFIITFIVSLIISYNKEDDYGNKHYISIGHIMLSIMYGFAGPILLPCVIIFGLIAIPIIIFEKISHIKVFKKKGLNYENH
jgi:hypothetical protein